MSAGFPARGPSVPATMTRHLLSSLDLSPQESNAWVDRARGLRDGGALDLARRVAALFFFQPSLRTRLSCEAALARFGGSAVAMTPGQDTWGFAHHDGVVMDGAEQEHVRELAPVVSRMVDLVGIRRAGRIGGGAAEGATYAEMAQDAFLRAFARHATVPVVNLESNRWHPCQGLADQLTIRDRLPEPRGKRYVLTWAWHPKALPVATPHSQLVAACDLGMEVVVLHPPGWDLDPEVLDAGRARAEATGGSLSVTYERADALAGAHVVCAKSWGRLDRYGSAAAAEREAAERAPLRDAWRVEPETLAPTADAFLLHCLPVRRNVVIADAVLDGPRSAVVDEAENRLWTAAAVFGALLGV